MAYFFKKQIIKKILIFRFIPVFTILNVAILLTNHTNPSVMFMSFRKKELLIPFPLTRKKSQSLTRILRILKMQRKQNRFPMNLLKNLLDISLSKTLMTNSLSGNILILCRRLLIFVLMFLN